MKPSRAISLIFGSLIALIGLVLLAGGGIVGWAVATQRDDAGYFTTRHQGFETERYALTSDKIDLGDPGPSGFGNWANAVVEIRVDAVREGDVFVGIGSEHDVEAYLAGVPHDDITGTSRFGRDSATYRHENTDGTSTPASPGAQTFWVARAAGRGTQSLTWNVAGGQWAIVVMNADGTPNVAAEVQLAGKVDHLVPIAVGLGAGGVVLLALGTLLIVVGVARPHAQSVTALSAPHPNTTVALVAPLDAATYPLRIEGHLDPDLSRWRWLIKWILAIPHFIVLSFLWVAFTVLTVVSFFSILFTGRYPRSIFEFNVGVLRWTWRVTYYATSGLGTDRYPPFTLAAADYPATLDIAYPEHLSRWRVLVKSWFMAFPQLLIVWIFAGTWAFGNYDNVRMFASPGLLGILVVVAGLILLFTGRYPPRLHDVIVGINRWVFRVIVYVTLMTDEYPPFHLDQGSTEPLNSCDALKSRDA